MRRSTILLAVMAWVLMAGCRTPGESPGLRLNALDDGRTFARGQAVDRLSAARIVLVGEHHDNVRHHEAQLRIIQALQRSGQAVAIGLEMFRRDDQALLDKWIAGKIGEEEFLPYYLDNWNYGWDLYGPIFLYARQQGIPMVGLNVSRKITSQVANHGFGSLSREQQGQLENIACNVTREYRDFIRRAYGAHGHGRMDFNRFCEAQLVWDSTMALNAVAFLEKHPRRIMVLLAGSGHARKMGIPTQIERINPMPYVVVLPETPGVFEVGAVTVQDADYLILTH